MKIIAALAFAFCLGVCASPVRAQERKMLEVDPTTITTKSGLKNLTVTALEGGGVKLTYDNSDFAAKGEILIRRSFDTPVTITRSGFEFNAGNAANIQASCSFAEKKWVETRLESQGAMLSEYVADFAAIAAAQSKPMQPVVALSIRVPVAKEAGEQTIELKNWWIE